jgi:hypothetical protein
MEVLDSLSMEQTRHMFGLRNEFLEDERAFGTSVDAPYEIVAGSTKFCAGTFSNFAYVTTSFR